MPVKTWGCRVIADLNWQGPKMFSLNRQPSTIPDYKGVYLISSRKVLYGYPHGRSSLAYIGSGSVADRLPAHLYRKEDLIKCLEKEGTMRFWYARVPHGSHDCVEQVLFDEFEERHGSGPILNKVRPVCSSDWSNFSVRHHNLAYPYDFTRSIRG